MQTSIDNQRGADITLEENADTGYTNRDYYQIYDSGNLIINTHRYVDETDVYEMDREGAISDIRRAINSGDYYIVDVSPVGELWLAEFRIKKEDYPHVDPDDEDDDDVWDMEDDDEDDEEDDD